jgi:hypothetical protein
MYTILLKTSHGWTDNLGFAENGWPTEAEASLACEELFQVMCSPTLKIVLTEDLSNYNLVS